MQFKLWFLRHSISLIQPLAEEFDEEVHNDGTFDAKTPTTFPAGWKFATIFTELLSSVNAIPIPNCVVPFQISCVKSIVDAETPGAVKLYIEL